MSNKFFNTTAPAVQLDLTLPPEWLLWSVGGTGIGLLVSVIVIVHTNPRLVIPVAGLFGLLLVIGIRRWKTWPWQRLVWKPSGALIVTHRDGSTHQGGLTGQFFLCRWLIVPALQVNQRCYLPWIIQYRQPANFRALAQRLRCGTQPGHWF